MVRTLPTRQCLPNNIEFCMVGLSILDRSCSTCGPACGLGIRQHVFAHMSAKVIDWLGLGCHVFAI